MKFFYLISVLFLATNLFADKPNIIFILVDDLGRQDLGCYGSTFYETPNIDSLASNGVKFNNAYVAHPRCVPSRFAIFSGVYPVRYGVPGFKIKEYKNTLPLKLNTFAEHLKTAGYSTAYIGKWHLGGHGGEPKYQGFDTSIMAGHAGAPPSYFFPYHKAKKGKSKEDFPPVKGKDGEYLTDRLTDEALKFIRSNKDKPFHLTLAHYAVHTPIEAPKDLVEKYKQKLKALKIKNGGPRSDKDVKEDTSGFYKTVQNNPSYAAMVEKVDQGVGRILEELKSLQIEENTVIIFTSDHGGLSSRGLKNKRELATSNLPFRHGKGWLYEGGNRVPLLVKWPAKVKKSLTTDQTITGTDHYPTILQMAGLPLKPEDHVDGESYMKSLNGETYDRGAIFWHSPVARPTSTGDTNMTAMLKGNFKLIECHDLKVLELYDLSADISESNNLAQEKPELTKELLAEMNEWKKSVNAKLKPKGFVRKKK